MLRYQLEVNLCFPGSNFSLNLLTELEHLRSQLQGKCALVY